MNIADLLTESDLKQIRASGHDPNEIIHELKVLRGGLSPFHIIRPAAIADGIESRGSYDQQTLNSLHDHAASAGRISSFIPASGSGTRLFQSLLEFHREYAEQPHRIDERLATEDPILRDAVAILENIRDLAIWNGIEECGRQIESNEQLLQALFAGDELRYHEMPKGLVPFHRYEDEIRTAFVEHIHEAAALSTDEQKICRIHFTVSDAHRRSFEEEWRRQRPILEKALACKIEIDFSIQDPATDTVAIDREGNLRRDSGGRILFQTGGHGSLLKNLNSAGGDIVLIKNVDNIATRALSEKIIEVRKQITGLLLMIEARVHQAIRDLRAGKDAGDALAFLEKQFGRRPAEPLTTETARREYALDQLDRPLRVCGMIETTGHAGGRPFWVDVENFGAWLQIVDGAEVDLNDERVANLFRSSRFFNPVELACSTRNVDRESFDLGRFMIPERALVAKKMLDGVPSLLYEHPGLWNGAMGLWNTVFVEVPDFVFHPVKSLSDLLTAGHRA